MNKQTDAVDEFDAWIEKTTPQERLMSGVNPMFYAIRLRDELIATRRELEKYQWISVEESPPPNFIKTKQYFLAAWYEDGEPESIELYAWYGKDGEYLNINTGNINHLGGIHNVSMFTHWMLPPTPQGG